MKTPFRLTNNVISHDTIEVLQSMLDDAKHGRVIGVAYCVMYKRREFHVDTAGEAHRNPVFTRGMLKCLDDKLKC